VSFFVVDLLILASDIGVMFPTGSGFRTVAIPDPAGIDSLLLGSHADLSSPDNSRTPILYLKLMQSFPCWKHKNKWRVVVYLCPTWILIWWQILMDTLTWIFMLEQQQTDCSSNISISFLLKWSTFRIFRDYDPVSICFLFSNSILP